jgi:multidrug transporter EmrE-like cation transporter
MTQSAALLLTAVCVAMIATGQILFKLTAMRSLGGTVSFAEQWLSWPLLIALFIYGAATVLWVWVLRFIPLNVAYPVYALAFAIVPVASYFVFREPLGWHHAIGGALILSGVVIITQGGKT